MSSLAISDLAARVSRLARRWKADAQGVAAVEFAMIVPIMAIMFIGAVELSQAITVDRRVTQVASSTADLVARWEKPSDPGAPNGISQSEMTDIMRAGGYTVAPYDQNPLQIIIRSVMSSPSSAGTTKQSWSCTYNGLGNTLSCACSNTTYTLPPNLVTTNDSVVISETTYSYKPLVFDYFMKSMAGSGGTGTYILGETIYMKPRSTIVNLLQSDNTTCPSPTF
jgi:Flp pilus assembly protein TadG